MILVSIHHVGKIVVPVLEYVDADRRLRAVDKEVFEILRLVLKNVDVGDYRRSLSRGAVVVFVISLFFPSIILVESFFVAKTDLLTYRYVVQGYANGYGALILFMAAKVFVHLFWFIASGALGYIIYSHMYIVKAISQGIKSELLGRDTLVLYDTLRSLLEQRRAASSLLRFYRRLTKTTHIIGILVKRTLLALLLASFTVIYYQMHYSGYTHMVTVLVVVSIAILLVVAYGMYIVLRINNELQTLLIIEIKNLRIAAMRERRRHVEKTTRIIEELVREMRHPIIVSRDLWEILASMISLAATITAIVAGLPAI